jgi:hypothetical protein
MNACHKKAPVITQEVEVVFMMVTTELAFIVLLPVPATPSPRLRVSVVMVRVMSAALG